MRPTQIHLLLACMITAGLVLDTSIDSIQRSFSNAVKARKQSQGSGLGSIAPSLSNDWDKFSLGAFKVRR